MNLIIAVMNLQEMQSINKLQKGVHRYPHIANVLHIAKTYLAVKKGMGEINDN